MAEIENGTGRLAGEEEHWGGDRLLSEGRLAGETAIITGATSGLGKALAVRFATEGANVLVAGRSRERGEAVCEEIDRLLDRLTGRRLSGRQADRQADSSAGGDAAKSPKTAKSPKAVFAEADLEADDCGEKLVAAAIETFGNLTVLINNAVDLRGDGPVTEVPPETWHRILKVNATAAGLLCQAAIPEMAKSGGGAILNISSRTAERASPRLAAYTASKGALNSLTRSIALDYAHLGIRCNTVQLGYIIHENRDAQNSPERTAEIEEMCLTRPATPEDVCHACVYLTSREAEVVTGITLNIDSGSTAPRAASFDKPR